MPQNFPQLTANNSAPAEGALAVTPSDSTDLSFVTRALYVGAGGNLNVDMAEGNTVLFVGVLSGTVLPIRVRRVRAASTTAASIVALY